jgi:hypothetical protein
VGECFFDKSDCGGRQTWDQKETGAKGTEPVTFHLGCDFFHDKDGTLCYAPRKYIEKMMDNYKQIFSKHPKFASSPFMDGNHPELNTRELLHADNMKKLAHASG